MAFQWGTRTSLSHKNFLLLCLTHLSSLSSSVSKTRKPQSCRGWPQFCANIWTTAASRHYLITTSGPVFLLQAVGSSKRHCLPDNATWTKKAPLSRNRDSCPEQSPVSPHPRLALLQGFPSQPRPLPHLLAPDQQPSPPLSNVQTPMAKDCVPRSTV